MYKQLEKLQIDLLSYREAVDQIFLSVPDVPLEWRRCLSEILICTTQLYLDYLLVMKKLSKMEAVSAKSGGSIQVQMNLARERNLREKLKHVLALSPSWKSVSSGEFIFRKHRPKHLARLCGQIYVASA
jgi:hypothetical protein